MNTTVFLGHNHHPFNMTLNKLIFGHFEKDSRPKNSSKSFKKSIICQLKTDFLLIKVPKLIYFAQKFAET